MPHDSPHERPRRLDSGPMFVFGYLALLLLAGLLAAWFGHYVQGLA